MNGSETGVDAIDATSETFAASVERALSHPGTDRGRRIGLVGCGWVAAMQLDAYLRAGLNVVALADHSRARATTLRDEYFPSAVVFDDEAALISSPEIDVVDVATHVEGRDAIVRSALRAGKHVLSQKPFVESLDIGIELAREAEALRVHLAVNQNGRWAPHFAVLLDLVTAGLIGKVVSADFFVAWPHDLVVADKPAFAQMDDLVLYDFGAHWFDILGQLMPEVNATVSALAMARPGQQIAAPVQASAIITSRDFLGTVNFRAGERFDEVGHFRVCGTRGVVSHLGTSLGGERVRISTDAGSATISVQNEWFRYGMAGTMSELLDAIESGRQPSNSARSALRGLELAFAAVESAKSGHPVSTNEVKRRPISGGSPQ
jgi:predicted dehydrogenase